MREYVLIPDTACDLTRAQRESLGIPEYLHGIIYDQSGEETLIDLDEPQEAIKAFFAKMGSSKVLQKTSTPTVGEVHRVFEKYAAAGVDVISLSLSSGLSATYAVTVQVAREVMEKYPGSKIYCVDSLCYSGGIAALLLRASALQRAGASAEQVVADLEQSRHRLHQSGSMDDLFFLVKTGRVSNAKAFFGSMLGLKLMADFNERGMVEVMGKCKGKRAMLDSAVAYIAQTIEDPAEQTIVITHSARESLAQAYAERIRAQIHPREILFVNLGKACGASIGPGLCAAFYFGMPTSQRAVREKEILTQILSGK
ncbi:MAG: DegV family protein [Eubacteriales bacterium]|nr:DegV family protein [Eubacteriales bacterium]